MDTSTQRPETVHIDEAARRADGTSQWFLEKPSAGVPTVPTVTANNDLKVHICGKEAYSAIYDDLKGAQHSIDIVAYGFDPAMELVRSGKDWPRGETYGELLERKAAELAEKGGQVRLLVWYSALVTPLAHTLDGYDPSDRAEAAAHHPYKPLKAAAFSRSDYNREWFRQATQGRMPGLTLLTRNPSRLKAISNLVPEEMPISLPEKATLVMAPTDHQKTILIDYAWEEGGNAVGYVMGLNAITDYWDTDQHIVDDPVREAIDADNLKSEHKHEKGAMGETKEIAYRTCKPYQDYACRLQGGALIGVDANFREAWSKAANETRPDVQGSVSPPAPPAVPKKLQDPPQPGQSCVQILRTYGEVGEKSIKAAYWQAVSFARNYIYIENQYFYYEEFVRQLTSLENFRRRQRAGQGVPPGKWPLHILIVIPQAEKDFMVPCTYDSVRLLGHAENMSRQDRLVDSLAGNPEGGVVAQFSSPLAHSRNLDRPSAEMLEDALGIKVSIAMLRTSNRVEGNAGSVCYREIYIHSKLMIIDDGFFTLGSANLNIRSMATDTEMNMSTNDPTEAKALRERVFTLHSGGGVTDGVVTGGDGSPEAMAAAFDDWEMRMNANRERMDNNFPLVGFLVPYKDLRSTVVSLA